ncbi:pentatricopeptide repeat-containing protein [Cucumis melo var. makuwa]|uniref:Pentatricopeptide repeat-containing protein n=1 Tax=Cucumis melo var. makuwa TaxID=1194695 RepID=A0A5A7USR2_CUCMM|nr:pentatricopeptide repeat-containing protein [Cucumis melo var. makuwa]
MDSLESNRTWHLVDLPPGCKAIDCKWVLRKKLKSDGSVDKYKTRLVAKGFSVKLFKNTGDSVNQTEYASIIGSLRYAADCTRPDIVYAVGLLCRITSRPSLEHWNAIERVMRYLKKTQNLGLHYNKFPAVLEGYNDADWNSLSDYSKATSGYIFNIAGGAVAWKSKK